jgi:threonine dehydrogenase-like Zn-dependent dehydrogenase
MRAITVIPLKAGSVRVEELEEPRPQAGELLVQGIALGVCGTDREIVSGLYGWSPPGRERLVLGHESLGRVLEAPPGSGFGAGDLVMGIVRRPDPVPCLHCAIGEWDMCINGRYTERGIKSLDGYGAERYRLEASFAVKVDPALGELGVLIEPTSILAKAWEHVDRIGRRARWEPHVALVTGAGPIGLLAALLSKQRGLEVHVLDRAVAGPKPALVRALGAHYHVGKLADACAPDVLLECTGAPSLLIDAIERVGTGGVLCLTGVSSGGRSFTVDAGAIGRKLVLENGVVFGSVNANRRHYQAAAEALGRADPKWLAGLITRHVSLGDIGAAFERVRDDIKVVVDLDR